MSFWIFMIPTEAVCVCVYGVVCRQACVDVWVVDQENGSHGFHRHHILKAIKLQCQMVQ